MRRIGAKVGARRLCRAGLIGAALACAVATCPGDAGACGNDVLPLESPRLTTLKLARNAVAARNYSNAGTVLRGSFPDIAAASPGSDTTETGALRVLAVAVARSGGRVSPHTAERKTTVEENLEWAVGTLRRINEHRKNEPWRQADLAEAMAKLPRYKAEARALLEQLDALDVLATAEGYATLSKLRDEDGDSKGRDAAIAQCKRMTRTPFTCTSWKA